MMAIEDDFIAFCFDEACAYIERALLDKEGPKPKWRKTKITPKKDNNKDVIEKLKSMQ